MSERQDIYLQHDGYTYIRVEPTIVGREMANLKLIVQLAYAKIDEIKSKLKEQEAKSIEYEDQMDEINDLEILIDDSNMRLKILQDIPY